MADALRRRVATVQAPKAHTPTAGALVVAARVRLAAVVTGETDLLALGSRHMATPLGGRSLASDHAVGHSSHSTGKQAEEEVLCKKEIYSSERGRSAREGATWLLLTAKEANHTGAWIGVENSTFEIYLT
jgi:hypothetical protein